jgi:predicted transcriptional regulator
MIKQRRCHGIVWRFDLIDARTGDTMKRSESEAKLKMWAETHGWVIPNAKDEP